MRWLLPLSVLFLGACHARFKRQAASIGSIRAEVITLSGPSVVTPTLGGNDVVSVAFDLAQTVRAGTIAQAIAAKVDPEQVNQAFHQGLADQLGGGPPFAYDARAGDVIQFELVDWGMEMWGFASPGVFTYELVARGFKADGKRFYRARFRCVTDAGMAGWAEQSPFAGPDNPDRVRNLPPEEVQAIFDATAADCGRKVVARMRYHAG